MRRLVEGVWGYGVVGCRYPVVHLKAVVELPSWLSFFRAHLLCAMEAKRAVLGSEC